MDIQKDGITTFDQTLSPERMDAYRLRMLNLQLDYAVRHSRYYQQLLHEVRLPLPSCAALADLPFTTAEDIVRYGKEMACVSAEQIARIVTIRTTGSEGPPKRLYFTREDLEHTVNFFHIGMQYLCAAGDEVFIFMPAASENSVGLLLAKGLEKMRAKPQVIGLLEDPEAAIRALRLGKPHTLVGIPSQMRKLALLAPDIRPANVLLAADYVSLAAKKTIAAQWDCEIFEHYGSTESAYGCAVECPAHKGRHIRHDEFLMEIIEPEGEAPVREGQWGEIVLSTLRREGMPLIRYRTGDMGCLDNSVCPCGSELPRLGRVLGRISEMAGEVTIYDLDETLFDCDGLLDYRASFSEGELSIKAEASLPGVRDLCLARLSDKWPGLPVRIELTNLISAGRYVKRAVDRY